MESNETFKMITDNPELAKALEEALRKNADVEELAGILADADIDADIADEVLAELQRRRGAEISSGRVDPEALKKVAGGNGDYGGCADNLYLEDCSSTVESGSWCGSDDWCSAYYVTYSLPDLGCSLTSIK